MFKLNKDKNEFSNDSEKEKLIIVKIYRLNFSSPKGTGSTFLKKIKKLGLLHHFFICQKPFVSDGTS